MLMPSPTRRERRRSRTSNKVALSGSRNISDGLLFGSTVCALFEKLCHVGADCAQGIGGLLGYGQQAHPGAGANAAAGAGPGDIAEIIAGFERTQEDFAVAVAGNDVYFARFHQVIVAAGLARGDEHLSGLVEGVRNGAALVNSRIHNVAAQDQGEPPVEHQAYAASPAGHEHGEHNEAPADPGQVAAGGNAFHVGNGAAMAEGAGLAESTERIAFQWLAGGHAPDIRADGGTGVLRVVGKGRAGATVRMRNSGAVASSPNVGCAGNAVELVG